MSDEELVRQLIAHGESERIEFKRLIDLGPFDSDSHKATSRREAVKDFIGMVNASSDTPGYFLFGVDDDRSLVGIHPIDEANLNKHVNPLITPEIRFRYFEVEIEEKRIGVAEILPSNLRFHMAKRLINPRGGGLLLTDGEIWVRHGTQNARIDAYDMQTMKDAYASRFSPKPILRIGIEKRFVKSSTWESADFVAECIDPNPGGGEIGITVQIENVGTATAIKPVARFESPSRILHDPANGRFPYMQIPTQHDIVPGLDSIFSIHLARNSEQSYEMYWKAFAENLHQPCSGTIRFHVS